MSDTLQGIDARDIDLQVTREAAAPIQEALVDKRTFEKDLG